MSGRSRGIYGWRIEGIEPADALLVSLPEGSPRLRVERCRADGWKQYGVPSHVDQLVEGGQAALFADQRLAVFDFIDDVPDDEMLHPWLVPSISQLAIRTGRAVLHGGVLATGGRAVAVLGDREAGKSTLMGWAATASPDLSVLADDLVVIEGGVVQAGPRCVDLRHSSVDALPSLPTADSRDGTRRRALLPQCDPAAQLAGFVVLGWGADVSVAPVPVPLRLPALIPHLSAGHGRQGLDHALSLAQYPVWQVQRPKDISLLQPVLQALISTVFGTELSISAGSPQVSTLRGAR